MKKISLIVLFYSLFFITGPAFAKRETVLQDVPLAVSAFGERELAVLGEADLDISKLVPKLNRYGSDLRDVYSLPDGRQSISIVRPSNPVQLRGLNKTLGRNNAIQFVESNSCREFLPNEMPSPVSVIDGESLRSLSTATHGIDELLNGESIPWSGAALDYQPLNNGGANFTLRGLPEQTSFNGYQYQAAGWSQLKTEISPSGFLVGNGLTTNCCDPNIPVLPTAPVDTPKESDELTEAERQAIENQYEKRRLAREAMIRELDKELAQLDTEIKEVLSSIAQPKSAEASCTASDSSDEPTAEETEAARESRGLPPPGLSAKEEFRWIVLHQNKKVGDQLFGTETNPGPASKFIDECEESWLIDLDDLFALYDVYNVANSVDSAYVSDNTKTFQEYNFNGKTMIGGELNYYMQGLFWRRIGVSKIEMRAICHAYHYFIKPESNGGGTLANDNQLAAAMAGWDDMDSAIDSGNVTQWFTETFDPDIELVTD